PPAPCTLSLHDALPIYAKADVPAARMAHQVDGSDVQLLDEGDDVVDMLGDRIGVALAIPLFGKKVPQADADQPMPLRERPGHAADRKSTRLNSSHQIIS